MKQKGLATIWIVLIVLVLAGLVGAAIYGIRKNLAQKKIVEEELQQAIRQGSEQLAEQAREAKEEAVDQESERAITQLISQFETYQRGQLSKRVLSLMTDPETAQEKSDYEAFLVLPDDLSAGYRLYSANDLSYKVRGHTVGQISKQSSSQYRAEVVEQRDSNWSQTTADWTVKNGGFNLIFVINKEGNSWSIAEYQASGKPGKYSGFSISNF